MSCFKKEKKKELAGQLGKGVEHKLDILANQLVQGANDISKEAVIQKEKDVQVLFQDLIKTYKKDYYKTMTTIHHEFLYSALHPLDDDLVLCLERNIYPKELEMHNLLQIVKTEEGFEVPLIQDDDDGSEKDNEKDDDNGTFKKANDVGEFKEESAFSSLMKQKISSQREIEHVVNKIEDINGLEANIVPDQDILLKKNSLLLNMKEEFKSENEQLSTLPKNLFLKIETSDDKNYKNSTPEAGKGLNSLKKSGFNPLAAFSSSPTLGGKANKYQQFHKRQKFEDFKIEGDDDNYKYAISCWKINKGSQASQQDEYGFDGLPVNNKFYISHNGKYVFFFLSQQDEVQENVQTIKRVVILDIQTLKIHKTFILPENAPDIGRMDLHDAALISINNIEEVLFLFDGKKGVYYFFDVNLEQMIWKLNQDYHFKQDDEDSKPKAGAFGLMNIIQRHSLLGKKPTNKILKIFFKEDGKNLIYLLGFSEQTKSVQLYKLKFKETDEDRVFQQSILEFQSFDITNLDGIHSNKNIDQFIFISKLKSYLVDRLPTKRDKEKQAVLNIKTGSYLAQKNSFLYDSLLAMYSTDSSELNFFYITNDKKKYDTQGMSHLLGVHSDIKTGKDKSEIIVLGKPSNLTPNICLNYITGISKNNDNADIKANQIQAFVCFVDVTPSFKYEVQIPEEEKEKKNLNKSDLSPGSEQNFTDIKKKVVQEGVESFKENESIAFLTQNKENIYMNILSYKMFDAQHKFYLTRTKQKVAQSKDIQSSIIKAALISASRHDSKGDYMLVLQFRNSVILKSLQKPLEYQNPLENMIIVSQPMLILPSQEKKKKGKKQIKTMLNIHQNDSIFLLQRDVAKIKILRIQFNFFGKDHIKNYYEFKGQSVRIFSLKNGKKFQIMDENMQIRNLQIDNKMQRLKEKKLSDIPILTKENWNQRENEQIEITKNAIYQRNNITFTFDVEDIQKDYQFMQTMSLFEMSEIRAGPIRIEQANVIMYVVKDLNKKEYENSQKSSDHPLKKKFNYIDEDEVEYKKDLYQLAQSLQSNNYEQVRVEADDRLFNLDGGYNFNDNNNVTSNNNLNPFGKTPIKINESHIQKEGGFTSQSIVSLSLSQKNKKMGIKPFDLTSDESSTIDILFVPFSDLNKIPLVYTNKKNKLIPKIQKSSFIDQEENMLCVIDNKYAIFSNTGDFQGYVKFVKETNINNQDYIEKQQHIVPLSKKLTSDLNNGRTQEQRQENEDGKYQQEKSQLDQKDSEMVENNMVKLNFGNSNQTRQTDRPLLNNNNQNNDQNNDNYKSPINENENESSPNNKPLSSKKLIDDRGHITKGSNSQNFDSAYIKKVTINSNNHNQHNNCVRDIKTYDYTQMQWIYMSNISKNDENQQNSNYTHNHDHQQQHDQKSEILNKTYFLFYTEDQGHLTESEHRLAVYTLEKKKHHFEFQFLKSCSLKRSTNFLTNNDYFDQVTINDKGQIIQVKTEDLFDLNGGQAPGFNPNGKRGSTIHLKKQIGEAGPDDEGLGRRELSSLASQSVFEIYLDEDQVQYNIKSKFPNTLGKRKGAAGLPGFGYIIIDNYLFVKSLNTIEYLKIFNIGDKSPSKAIVLDLQLDEKTEINRIISTEEYQLETKNSSNRAKKAKSQQYYCPDLVQIIFTDFSNKKDCHLYVATWDLIKNIEYSMLQVQDINRDNAHYQICKGVNQKLNYIVNSESFYDIQFMAPFSFIKTIQKENYKNYAISINEVKISKDKSIYLGLGDLNNIYTGYTMHNLLYWREILSSHNIIPQRVMLQHFQQRYNQNTIFHLFALDPKFLKLVYDEIKKFDSEDNQEENKWKSIFFQIIYPNQFRESPFDMVMAHNSPKCIQIMLQMLIELPDDRISLFIKKHFSKLFTMNLEVFEEYLDVCTFTNSSIQNIESVKWASTKDEIFTEHHCSYIASDFVSKISKSKQSLNAAQEKKKQQALKKAVEQSKNLLKSELTQYDPQLQDDEDQDKNELQRIEVVALEFDWIFYGKDSSNFIKRLSETNNDNLFTINSVRIIILFLWTKYFTRILYSLFFPFLVYFMFFVVYVTHVYEQNLIERAENEQNRQAYANQFLDATQQIGFNGTFVDGVPINYQTNYYWWRLDTAFIIVSLVLFAYFLIIELIQIAHEKFEHFKNFWNWVNFISMGLNIAFIVCDLKMFDPVVVRPLGSIAVFMMYMKVFFFLRLFSSTSSMIRLIVEVCKDMGSFAFVLLLAMLAWGNTFYILASNAYLVQTEGMTSDEIEAEGILPFILDKNFLIALVYSFRMGLGDFQTEYYGLTDEPLLWVLFIGEAVLIQVILLNLIISLMGETFGKVQAIAEQAKLKEICNMICEHEFIMSREESYKRAKYIYVVKLEQAGQMGGPEGGPIQRMSQALLSQLSDAKKQSKAQIENLKEEIIASQKGIDAKLSNNQSNASQINAMQREMKSLSDIIESTQSQLDEFQKLNKDQLDKIYTELMRMQNPNDPRLEENEDDDNGNDSNYEEQSVRDKKTPQAHVAKTVLKNIYFNEQQ